MTGDLFDAALHLEEQHIAEGYEEGLRDGQRSGHAEGRALGLQKGFELGHEVGFYSGCCQLWRQLQARDPQLFGPRVDKGIASLEDMVKDFPLGNPQDERLQELTVGTPPPLRPALAPPNSNTNSNLTLGLQDERLQELMDGMRGRFKALVAMMGLQHAYAPPDEQQPQQAQPGMQGSGGTTGLSSLQF